MHGLMKLKDTLIDELERIGQSGELSKSMLEQIDTLAHATKNIAKVIECCEKDEYSMAMNNRSYDGRSYYSRDGYYYDGGNSYRRGRAANGRFVSRDGSEMARKLREMIADAPDEGVRGEIQRLAEKMEQM